MNGFSRFCTPCMLAGLVLLLTACGGGGGGNPPAPPPPPPANSAPTASNAVAGLPRFAYVANAFDDAVSIYTVNAGTGMLRHNGYVSTGEEPRSVTIDPLGQFAYVANAISDDVSAYRIDPANGALS